MTSLAQAKPSPIPHDAARGALARARFADLPGDLPALIEGVAGCSPYLDALLSREAEWLASIANTPLAEVLAAALVAEGDNFNALSDALRQAKRRVALLTALADLGGLWRLEDVTGALTALSDFAVNTALRHLIAAEIARGKIPGASMGDIDEAAGMVALAMGKGGAGELNYSSDIDLIMLFDETRFQPDDYATARAAFIRVTQRMVKLLSEVTAEGYVFRTDLRLRPDPSVTPVCIAMEPAESYYESLGRTWERAAFIKARPCAGAIAAGQGFLDRLTPFVWRRHLDFAAIEDAHNMRLRIRDHKGLAGAIFVAGHDLKLGQGGIRDIEFFAQTRQLICGGRDADLRQRGTRAALAALAKKGWIDPETASALDAAYIAHRTLEHRLQMLDDAQTHIIPEPAEKRARLAAFCGASDQAAFEAEVLARLQRVQSLTEPFFSRDTPAAPSETPDFERPELAENLFAAWPRYPALRTARGRKLFDGLKPALLARLARAPSPDEALLQFDAFLRGLPAGVQLFALFEANPELLEMLVDICGSAPELARYLGRNPKVFDAVIGSDFFGPLPDMAAMARGLAAALQAAQDYEDALNATRVWAQELRFRIGVHLLRGICSAAQSAKAYSDLAETCLAQLFPIVCKHLAERHGFAPGKGAAVIAMGKLGSREMTVTSDLDLIVIYDGSEQGESDGKRPLLPGPYYARLTQSLISALTVETSEGRLYEVDLRLRPSGRKGPVAVALSAFETYHRQEAWTWEHLALLRARVVAGTPEMLGATAAALSAAQNLPLDAAQIRTDVVEMRARLAAANAAHDDFAWEVKLGRGRLLDIELMLQAGALMRNVTNKRAAPAMARALARDGWLGKDELAQLEAALTLFATVQQIGRLAIDGRLEPARAGQGVMDLLCRATETADTAVLETLLLQVQSEMCALIDSKLGKQEA
ncbi:bifunctional [glutamine synthetase] adenylyltransferase/[glutamine synthetase]-adenylyl-L-tyrosine phosphorylase [Abyssibius alkaniclasticus]|uniref:bifunctional [glutamine synthetase] adenylyltransferase/[glutamine synthetase]-adenylyl-L-tyrosine phosphorylase n=1 Tax=Abyssibius alkaniclasticus TaxID=2881234 RepID=UPI00405964E3